MKYLTRIESQLKKSILKLEEAHEESREEAREKAFLEAREEALSHSQIS